jgi:AcrR family transcriptional regulator
MARPKLPLISRREVLAAALRIIDHEGLAALSIRRLATEFKVNGASFYYHFTNKDEIIVGAAELALDNIRVPQGPAENWTDWLVRNATLYRKTLVAHPDLIMVMVRGGRFGIGHRRVDATFRRLEQEGVPPEAGLALFEALETFATGSALAQCQHDRDTQTDGVSQEHPGTQLARGRRALSFEQQFNIGCRAIMRALAERFGIEITNPVSANGKYRSLSSLDDGSI